MEALFKKYFWVVKTLGIAAACGLAASAVTTQVGSRLLFDSEAADDTKAAEAEGEAEADAEGEDEDATKKPKGIAFTDDAFGVDAESNKDKNKAKDKERVGERIRKSVATKPFNAGPDCALNVTASVGISALSGIDEAVEDLLKRADQALYRAKREGRNRVIAEAA